MSQSVATQTATAPQGMRAFTTIWFGQLVSLIGSSLTTFALGVWAYDQTGSVTLFAFITFMGMLPGILVSPFAGALVDRWDRRRVMIACDTGAAVTSLLIAGLLWAGQLAMWHIYVIVGINSILKAFQMPAYTAAITLMIPKEQLARASGMMQFGAGAAQIAAPFLAGILFGLIGLAGIILVDFTTFLVAVSTLLLVRVPSPPPTGAVRKHLLREAADGLAFITTRPGLLGMLIFFAIVNFGLGMAQVLFAPLVLKFATPVDLGLIAALGGAGVMAGSLVISAKGLPKPRIHGVLGFGILFGISFILAGLRAWVPLISIASFVCMFCVPYINGANQVIWQLKVPPEMQGRAFATRLMLAWSTAPIAYVLAGPLADGVFEPLLMPGGALAGSLGAIIGTGPGRGVGTLFLLIGILPLVASIGGYLYKPLREIEEQLPDAIAATPPPAPPKAEPAEAEGEPPLAVSQG
jgi:DHA3 family macrolide efflux protein-like MFS transporter